MRMKCPHCGVSGRADSGMSGRKVKCPKCRQLFLVPVIEKGVEGSDTENEALLTPDILEDSGIGDDPVVDSQSEEAVVVEDLEIAAVDEQAQEPAEIDDQMAGIGEEHGIAGDIEIDEQPGGASAEEPAEEPEDEILLTTTGFGMEPEEFQDEQEYELDFPDEDSAVQDLQDIPEESTVPEMFEDTIEPHLDEENTVEDDLSEKMPEEQDLDLFSSEEDEGKDGLTSRDDEFPDLSNEGVDWEQEQEPVLSDGNEDLEIAAGTVEEELRAELEAMLAGTCSACGKTVDKEETFNEDGRIICSDCFNRKDKREDAEMPLETVKEDLLELQAQEVSTEKPGKKIPSFSYSGDFSVIGVLKEAWNMTRGLKGSVWGGILVMMLILFGMGAAAVMLPSAGAPAGGTVTAWINILIQLISTILSMTFTAGLMYMGVRRVADKGFSWKMIFTGFSRLGHVAVAGILMTLLITSGFLLLVLPGIYLAVGYSLTFPLILDKGLGPWEAMETSRRSIHRRWWPVFCVYLLMYPIYFVSCIPFGLGMIWTIPMFIALSGVLYRLLCMEEAE